MALPEAGQGRLDATGLADLYERYYDRIARYIAARTGDRDGAQDMAGEVFLRALESIGTFEDRGIPIQAWLFRVAHNLVVDHFRRNSRRKSVPLDEAAFVTGSVDPAHEVERTLTLERVYRAMTRLAPAQQEVILLRLVGELSSEEAGTVMGRTSGAIRELQRTALKALRTRLADEPELVDRREEREE